MKIYLMRHGQTTGDIEDRFGGDYDDHLTELGKKQASDFALKINGLRIEKIYYSPRIRASETASIINKATNIPLEEVDDLRERNAYGILTGKLKSEAKTNHPDLIEKLKDLQATIEGAENYLDFKKRVLQTFHTLTLKPQECIGIITHGGVISCFLREIIGKERKRLDDCAIIELDYQDGNYKIISSIGLEIE